MESRPPAWATFLINFRQIDRRIIYTLVIIVLVLPMLVPMQLPIFPFQATRALKQTIDDLPADKLIVIACDWGGGTKGECQPLTTAVMDYLFRENRPFAIFGFDQQGPELGQKIAEELARKHKKQYGVDWINWGFRPAPDKTLVALMNDLPRTIPKDIRGVELAGYPMMAGIRTLADVGLIYEVTGASYLDIYLQFAGGVTLAQGCTAVIGPEEYPYMQSGQLKGLLVGLGGAAQFETLTEFTEADGTPGGKGTRGMGSQSLGHLLIMLLIVLGNLAVWAERRIGGAPTRPLAPGKEG